MAFLQKGNVTGTNGVRFVLLIDVQISSGVVDFKQVSVRVGTQELGSFHRILKSIVLGASERDVAIVSNGIIHELTSPRVYVENAVK